MQRHFIKTGVSVGFSHWIHRVPCAFHVTCGRVFCSQPFPSGFLLQTGHGQTLFIRVYRTPSIDDYFELNMCSPLLELLFLEQTNGIFASYLVEIDLAKIALSLCS